jgi:hypothetical protein
MRTGRGIAIGAAAGLVVLAVGLGVLTLFGVIQLNHVSAPAPGPTSIPAASQTNVPSSLPPGGPRPSQSPTLTSSPISPAATVGQATFEISISSVTGTGLSRTITAQITNTGSVDAHNVRIKIEVSSGGSRVQLNGQDSYQSSNLGSLKAGATISPQATVSINPIDGLRVSQSGAQVIATIYSDDGTQSLSYNFGP